MKERKERKEREGKERKGRGFQRYEIHDQNLEKQIAE
jgi:hypothetical protein